MYVGEDILTQYEEFIGDFRTIDMRNDEVIGDAKNYEVTWGITRTYEYKEIRGNIKALGRNLGLYTNKHDTVK